MTATQAKRMAANPAVAYVEQDQVVSLAATQTNPPSWGLDRIDQRNRPLNSSYTYPNTASNVRAYIIDTGISRSHTDFGGRAVTGYDAVTSGGAANDCNGHGTHVAGTVGGTRYGVAKSVRLVAVRVLNCSGSGTNAGVIAGINWVTANAVKPAVANMSLGGGASTTIDNAVANSINSGISYAIAAGNSNANACNSPRPGSRRRSPSAPPPAPTRGRPTPTTAAAWTSSPRAARSPRPGTPARRRATRISGTSMAARTSPAPPRWCSPPTPPTPRPR